MRLARLKVVPTYVGQCQLFGRCRVVLELVLGQVEGIRSGYITPTKGFLSSFWDIEHSLYCITHMRGPFMPKFGRRSSVIHDGFQSEARRGCLQSVKNDRREQKC